MSPSDREPSLDLDASPTASSSASPSAAPTLWRLVGEKLGDNAQTAVITEALGWPCEDKAIFMQERFRIGKPRHRASLSHIDRDRSDALSSPWPDLVIAVGRRLSNVGLWIKRSSGDHTKQR